MQEDYDVIVAGAGLAGSLAAAASAKGGAKTLLLDRNDPKEAGKKTNWGWVCGDAVASFHIKFLEKELGLKLTEPFLDVKVDGVYALSPDLEHKYQFEGEGYSLDRPKLAKKLVEFAVKQGAEYRPHYEIEGPILLDNKVAGVFGRDEKKNQFKLKSKLVIDALGMASMIRRKLPQNHFIENTVSTDDIESTGRYILKFTPDHSDLNYYDPKNALIHLNQQLAPGGYGWIFPKTKGRINIGIGVEKKSLEIRNSKMNKTDTLHTLIDQYVQWNPLVKKSEIDLEDNNGKGYWSVTVRRQFDSLVYSNYLGAGDSMAMANPISAGGIGPAMVSGIIAGQVAGESINAKDMSIDFLWRYNTRFNDAYGSKTAGLEAFRIYLQSMNNNLINYGMGHFLTEEEAVALSYGNVPELSLASKFNKVLSGISNINAFRNLLYIHDKMKKLNDLYSKYPKDTNSFKAWKEMIHKEMHEIKEKFKPNPI